MSKAVEAIKTTYDTQYQYGSISNVLCKLSLLHNNSF